MMDKQQRVNFPQEGENPEHILQKIREIKQADVDWKEGKVWSLGYYADDTHDQLLKDAHAEMFSTNYLNPFAFKSLQIMEQEAVQMVAHMMHGDEQTVGVMSSGGTESILLAMYGYRQRARKLNPRIIKPEVVLPATIHPAFDKAAELFAAWSRWKQRIRKKPLHFFFLVAFSFLFCESILSQPYVDPIQVRYMNAFRSKQTPATPFSHLWIGSDLPIRLKGDAILLASPYFDQWTIDSASTEEIYPVVQSIALPIGLIMPLKDSKWTLTVIPIVRSNGEKLFADNTFQFGGVALAGYARKPGQKFRIGVYANAEFFGLFVIPLLGADWRIDDRNYLFGVLPGRLTFEHKWNERFYGGVTFRAPTTSYRLSDGSFIRLDDNQLSLFVDFYIAKQFCITIEPGYGVLRRLRTGVNTHEYLTKVKWGDGLFLKLSAAYRIRLD